MAFVSPRIPGPILSPAGPQCVAPLRKAGDGARPGSFVVRNPGPILSGLATLGGLHKEAIKLVPVPSSWSLVPASLGCRCSKAGTSSVYLGAQG
jgi:hypothetical protein